MKLTVVYYGLVQRIVLLFLFTLLSSDLFAQYGQISREEEEKYKSAGVKSLSFYFFNSPADSILQYESFFSSAGKLVKHIMYHNDGTLNQEDTLFYNSKGQLIKKLTTSIHGNNVSLYQYDHEGNLIFQSITGDSVNFSSRLAHEKGKGRDKTSSYYADGDSMIIEKIYNRKGAVTKMVVTDRSGISITKTIYDWIGRVAEITKTRSGSKSVFTFRYDSKGRRVQENIVALLDGKRWLTSIIYSYYTNGLIFETFRYYNRKPSSVEKVYYSFH